MGENTGDKTAVITAGDPPDEVPITTGRPSSAGTYWRRRFVVLCIGLAVFAVIAWAVSTALSVGPDRHPGTSRRTAAGAGAVPGRSHTHGGNHKPVRGRTSPAVGAHHHGRTGTTASPAAAESTARPTPSGQPTYPGIRPAFCARAGIVLSLFASQATFGPRQFASFDLNVVTTQPQECSFNVGSKFLALIIKEGPVRVWNSADCARGSSSLITALRRGVPTTLPVTWNRRTSAPGCSGRVTQVPPGVYTAYAAEGSITSPPLTFRVR